MSFLSNFQPFMTSLKNNKRKRKTVFEKDIYENNQAYSKFVDTKKMTPVEFKRFQKNLKETNRKRERKIYLIFGALMTLVIGVILYFLFYFTF